jgi:hypothetical protein
MTTLDAAILVKGTSGSTATRLGDNPATDRSIAAYNQAGESMRGLMDLVWKISVALFVLLVAAWLVGVLPIAVQVF